MFSWERDCIAELPDRYWKRKYLAICASSKGLVIVYYDWPQFVPREGLAIIGCPYTAPEQEWMPPSPAHFWQYLQEAEKYVADAP